MGTLHRVQGAGLALEVTSSEARKDLGPSLAPLGYRLGRSRAQQDSLESYPQKSSRFRLVFKNDSAHSMWRTDCVHACVCVRVPVSACVCTRPQWEKLG